jgi:hydroxyacyl-ACP dehydratase HTD2-like protein with hotdog domain
MADDDIIGKRYPGYTFPVERGKIREFARATMTSNPAYFDDPDPVVPPTGLQFAGFWAPRDQPSPVAALNLNLARVLHGGQEYVFHGPPPRAGDVLTTESWIEDIYEKEGKRGGTMRFAVMVTEFHDESGTVVAESRTTMIETAKPATEAS